MDKCKTITLELLRIALSDSPIEESSQLFEGCNWEKIARYSAQQGITALVWDGLNRVIQEGKLSIENLPDRATKLQWALAVERLEKRYAKQVSVIKRLASILEKSSITIMILKGYGLSLCYPKPSHRSCSDIDIWLYGKQKEGDDLLHKSLGITIDQGKHHHTVFYVDGVMVENHFDFLNLHAHRSSREIERELLKRTEEHSDEIGIGDSVVYMPPSNLHALFLLRHSASHFAAEKIVLRHICDWAMFLKHNASNIDWEWLYDVCRTQNMDRFLDALNGYAVDYFNIDSRLLPNFARRNDLEQRILNDILQPEFCEPKPEKGLIRIILFKYRRWWANRWKHHLVYREGLLHSFVTQAWSHILKPKAIKS